MASRAGEVLEMATRAKTKALRELEAENDDLRRQLAAAHATITNAYLCESVFRQNEALKLGLFPNVLRQLAQLFFP